MADKSSKALRKRFIGAGGLIILFSVILGGAVLVFLFNARVSIFAINGDSMEPTFSNGDSIVLKQEKQINPDQIMVFTKPSKWEYMGDDPVPLVKRVAAVAGDTIEFDGKSFFVNGESVYDLSADYVCDAGEVGYSHTLDKTQVFVMGDNAEASLDSRRIFCDGNAEDMFVPYRSMVDYGNVQLVF